MQNVDSNAGQVIDSIGRSGEIELPTVSDPDHRHQRLDADDVHDTRQIVGRNDRIGAVGQRTGRQRVGGQGQRLDRHSLDFLVLFGPDFPRPVDNKAAKRSR